ncbi:MAG: nicotinamide mononucleotide transporter [Actinomycetia bacterium]|nr:nicotinamide mononucleotide transporter [Actinomycetes bacterium]MCP4958178.1 nicotinamide mononucleotide transporter [Actinomycetes bacterium]
MSKILREATSTAPEAAPWFGRPWEHRQAAVAAIGSLAACWLYWFGTRLWAPEVVPSAVEFGGTAASLWSVWITQRRNVLALPAGIISVVLMGWFFRDIGLVGQTWLHWGYYLPVQFWSWSQWTRGGDDRTELIVTRLSNPVRAGVACVGLVATVVFGWVLETGWEDALHTYWDASIVAASVVAMVLLSRKKVESWWLWVLPVNVSAIGLYLSTGAYMFAALYVLFLFMAFVGLAKWMRAEIEGVA